MWGVSITGQGGSVSPEYPIDINKFKIVPLTRENGTLHLIGVASLTFWHGYDRIIEGMKDYYSLKNNKLVYCHIVGDSKTEEALKYQNLVNKYNLQDYVIFHGKKFGNELDEIFNKCQMGLGCLGVHRKGITYIKSIKNSEYCGRGIPFVYSEIDDSFEDKPFILKVPADDSPINIYDLVNFFYSKKFNPTEIRKFAEENLTWEKQIAKIVDQLYNFK